MNHCRLQWQPLVLTPVFSRDRSVSKPFNQRKKSTMAKPKIPIIKPVLGVVGMPDTDLLQRLNAVHDGMFNNPAFPSPPVDMASFKAVIDAYTAASAASLDGGKAATTLRDKRRTDAIIMFRSLGHYVEANSKNDMNTFVSSGFVASTTGQRNPPQPVTVPSIVSVDQGNSGQLLVSVQPVAKARTYELRFGLVPAAGGTINWTTTQVASTKPATPINNLTPGGTYTFQVRAFGKLGFSDWSSSVDKMCT
jgi:hypothetical protein